MKKNTRKYTHATAVAALLGISSTPLIGAGFQLAERSVSGLGRAFSGEAAIADDASVIASNPAGMILLDDNAISSGLQYIRPQVDVSAADSIRIDRDVASDALVPYFYFSKKINDNLSAGIGLFSSFGLATDYSSGFAAQAGTDISEITTVTLNPALAYRINEKLTFGAGINIMFAEGRITDSRGGSNFFDLEGDDLAIGWNVGVLYEITESTRIGLQYRSSVDLNIEGTAQLGALFGPFAGSYDATLDIELPEIIELSAYHELNDQWAIHADITWTGWSSFETLAPITGTLVDSNLAKAEDWDDAFRYAIGATYKHNDRLTFRCGIALDESPVPGVSRRTLRIPDADRVWASIGATIKLNECYNLDLGYTHLFADDAVIDTPPNGNEDLFAGTASGDVDIIGVGISGSF